MVNNDYSFLPVQKKQENDFDFLPIKSESIDRDDISFLPVQAKTSIPSIEKIIDVGIEPIRKAVTKPVEYITPKLESVKKGIEPLKTAFQPIAKLGEIATIPTKVINASTQAFKQPLQLGKQLITEPAYVYSEWERRSDEVKQDIVKGINEPLKKLYPVEQDEPAKNAVDLAISQLVKIGETIIGDPNEVMKAGQMLAPATVGIIPSSPSDLLVIGTASYLSPMVAKSINSFVSKGILNDALRVMENKLLTKGYNVDQIAKASANIKKSINWYTFQGKVPIEDAIKMNIETRRAGLPEFFERQVPKKPAMLPEKIPTPTTPIAGPEPTPTPQGEIVGYNATDMKPIIRMPAPSAPIEALASENFYKKTIDKDSLVKKTQDYLNTAESLNKIEKELDISIARENNKVAKLGLRKDKYVQIYDNITNDTLYLNTKDFNRNAVLNRVAEKRNEWVDGIKSKWEQLSSEDKSRYLPKIKKWYSLTEKKVQSGGIMPSRLTSDTVKGLMVNRSATAPSKIFQPEPVQTRGSIPDLKETSTILPSESITIPSESINKRSSYSKGIEPPPATSIAEKSGIVKDFDENKIKAIVESAGAKYVGIQKGLPAEEGIEASPDLVLFNEPVQESTLAVPLEQLSIENVKNRISKFKGKELTPEEKIKRRIELGEGGYVNISELSNIPKYAQRYFTRTRGVGEKIDALNDVRLGKIAEKAFDAPLTGKRVRKYIEDNPNTDIKETVLNVLKGESNINLIPEEIRSAVKKMRNDVDGISRIIAEHVDRDTLKTVITNNLGRYLGRYYKLFEYKHYEPKKEIVDKAISKLREMHPRAFKSLTDDDMKGVIKNIIDKSNVNFFVGKRKISVPQNHFIKRKDIPKEIRELYGEIEDPVYLYLKTISDQSRVAFNYEFLNKLSDIPGIYSNMPNLKQYKQLPDTKAWGKLKGKYIDEDLHEFLIQAIDPVASPIFRFIERYIVNPFKVTKTVFSLPSHPRNFFGNIMFSILARNNITNPANFPYYKKALKIMMNKNTTEIEAWKDLIRRRIIDVQYWGSEMPKMMEELIADPTSYAENIFKKYIKKPINSLGELYNAEDSIYRIATDIKYREKYGMSPEESAKEVDRYFTNYSKVSKATDILRRGAVFGPFFSFRANTIRISKNAATDGVKDMLQNNYGKIASIIFALSFPTIVSKISALVHDVDEEEIANFKKVMPSYRRNAQMVFYRDSEGKLKAFDLTYIWPTGDFERAARALMVGDIEDFTSALNLFMHPLADAYSIIINNQDPMFKQQISNINDPITKQLMDRATQFLRTIYLPASSPIPSIKGLEEGVVRPGVLTGYQFKAIYNAMNGVVDKYGRKKEFPEEIKNFVTGIRTWKVHPDIIVRNYKIRKKWEINRAKKEYRLWLLNNRQASQSEKLEQKKIFEYRLNKLKEDLELANKVDLKKLNKRE